MPLLEGGEGGVDLAFCAGLQDIKLQPFCARRALRFLDRVLGIGIFRV